MNTLHPPKLPKHFKTLKPYPSSPVSQAEMRGAEDEGEWSDTCGVVDGARVWCEGENLEGVPLCITLASPTARTEVSAVVKLGRSLPLDL